MQYSSLCLLLLASRTTAVLTKWEATNFCKCICFQANSTILHLDNPDDPSQPCLSCTKQWCLNQNLLICAGASIGDTNPDTATGKEGDVEARCFQRDSPRDQLVVTLFLLTVFGLLLVAGIKTRIAKAGIAAELPWHNGRRWLGLRRDKTIITAWGKCLGIQTMNDWLVVTTLDRP
ncbi:hypothetical protein Ac2012v2_000678 [Leucoagaricus gongylophorus]